MKLTDALQGVTTLGFDTAPLIYFVERKPGFVDIMRTILRQVDEGKISGNCSDITLIEVLTQPKRLKNHLLGQEYRDLLVNSRNFILEAITVEVAEITAQLRAQYNLRTPDAIQLATSLNAGCQAFLTNDHLLKRVSALRILLIDELEL